MKCIYFQILLLSNLPVWRNLSNILTSNSDLSFVPSCAHGRKLIIDFINYWRAESRINNDEPSQQPQICMNIMLCIQMRSCVCLWGCVCSKSKQCTIFKDLSYHHDCNRKKIIINAWMKSASGMHFSLSSFFFLHACSLFNPQWNKWFISLSFLIIVHLTK